MSIRDLLTHRSGLPRYDFLRFGVMLSREELVRRLRYLPPTASIREKYQYQNLMYTAAGYLTGQLAGLSWEELMEQRIFAPLGMKQDSTVRVSDTQRRSDFASPHEEVGGQVKPVELYDYQKFGVGPNGAVNIGRRPRSLHPLPHGQRRVRGSGFSPRPPSTSCTASRW